MYEYSASYLTLSTQKSEVPINVNIYGFGTPLAVVQPRLPWHMWPNSQADCGNEESQYGGDGAHPHNAVGWFATNLLE